MSDLTPAVTLSIEEIEATRPPATEPVAQPFAGDEQATWHYWTNVDTGTAPLPDEWVWERLRMRRDALLTACDFRMVSDAAWDVTPWTAYRQALRDLPDTTTDPRLAVWPTSP